MDWQRDLPTWPHSDWSRRVDCRPHRWHVQEQGHGATVLFLHGAGASTHSWRRVMADLAQDHHVVAVDLPGHGFTEMGTGRRSGLDPMARDTAQLCLQEGWRPSTIVAHSAGVAVALNLIAHLDPNATDPPRIIGVNPALQDFDGLAGHLFPVMAKALALNPLTAWAFTLGPERIARARRLIASTGSHLDDAGLAYYARLMRDRDHVQGTLNMMAQWSLKHAVEAWAQRPVPCHFVLGLQDLAVPPPRTLDVVQRLQKVELTELPDHGHLLHEETPQTMIELIRTTLSG